MSGRLIVVPGEVIAGNEGYLRGHGTYLLEGSGASGEASEPHLAACVSGVVERVNKLISVRPVASRYVAEVGELVVGRITEVASKRWKVDVGGYRDATLMLSSVNLPGGTQRMRTYEDQLQMRSFFQENDLIAAEVQQVNSDGSIALHTRSLKYGKLENGQVVTVPPVLIRRLKHHFLSLEGIGVDVLLGKNGRIWVTRTIPDVWGLGEEAKEDMPKAEVLMKMRELHSETPIEKEDRNKVCRVTNSIVVLQHAGAWIDPESILSVYSLSIQKGMSPKDMMQGSGMIELCTSLTQAG